MKKITTLLVAFLLVVAMGIPVFAASSLSDQDSGFINGMFDSQRNQINSLLESGEITQDQADEWNQHFEYMQKFHQENGFGPGMMYGNSLGRGCYNRSIE